MSIIPELVSDDVLDTAYDWLHRRRRNYSANSDVWSFRRHWPHERERSRHDLQTGNYRDSSLGDFARRDVPDVAAR